MATTLTTMRFTVEQYHAMGRAGILTEDDRVELIDGDIVKLSPIGPDHATCVKRLLQFFAQLLVGRITLSVQDPVVLGDYSEPQPDIALLRFREDFYKGRHPAPGDVLLAIEVADTTVERDRGVKLPLYASSGIRECLLVNLPDEVVELHRRPSKSGYKSVRRLRRGDKFTLLAFPDVTISVTDILGPR